MARWASSVVFLAVGVGLSLGAHYFLWARLVRDVGFSPPTTRMLGWLAAAVALLVPLAIVSSRFVRPDWSKWWVVPVYFWIGVAVLLILSVLAVGLLRVGCSAIGLGIDETDAGRRQFVARVGALVALAIGLSASGWAFLECRKVRVKRVEVPLKKLPKALDGFRIVQLSDLHVGPAIGRKLIEQVVARVNQLAPDLVAITGDLVDGSVDDLRHDVAPLADLSSTHGTYFVTGNHEYHSGAPEWCEHLGKLGVRVLRNEHVELGENGNAIHLAGIDDYGSASFGVGHRPDLPKAVAGRDRSRALILLAHQPRAVHEAAVHGVDLQLSGHTHGGQLWPLGWIQRLEQPVVAGLAKLGETFIYVSCGTGFSGPPMRLDAPPEITHIVLRSA